MTFSFAFICTDPTRTACCLEPYRAALTRAEGAPDGWGLAYYQAGQPLLRKQPRALEGPLDFAAQLEGLRANAVLGHVRQATIGGPRTENTHPFRYRTWTFAGCGTMDLFDSVREDLLQAVPEFIRRNIRGSTDSEHIFHLFLSFLNDTGRLEDPRVPSSVAAEALVATFSYLDRLVRDRGGSPSDGSFLVSNGQFVMAIRRGTRLRVARQASHSCRDASGKLVVVPGLRSAVILCGDSAAGPGWEDVPDQCIVGIDDRADIETTPIG